MSIASNIAGNMAATVVKEITDGDVGEGAAGPSADFRFASNSMCVIILDDI